MSVSLDDRVSNIFNDRRTSVDDAGVMPPPASPYPEPKKAPKKMYKWTGDEP